MRYPEFLGKNGNIGFVAPSLGCTTEPYRTAFDKALDKFRQDGYNTIIGPNCYEAKGMDYNTSFEYFDIAAPSSPRQHLITVNLRYFLDNWNHGIRW